MFSSAADWRGTQPASMLDSQVRLQPAAAASWRCVRPTARRRARIPAAVSASLVMIVAMAASQAQLVPRLNDREDGFQVTPGEDLRALILETAEHGRPAWPVLRGLVVPRLTLVPVAVGYGDGWAYVPPGEALSKPASSHLHSDALLLLETAHPTASAHAHANRSARAQLRALVAAALRDVCGYPIDAPSSDAHSVCAYLGTQTPVVASKVVTRGRKLWAKLAAWPWWALNPQGGPLPKDWWTQPRVIHTLEVWRSSV